MRKVVVTGMGVVSPIGSSVESFRSSLIEGRSGIRRVSRFDVRGFPTQVAAQVNEIDHDSITPKGKDVKTEFAVNAAEQAMQDAFARGIPEGSIGSLSIGVGLELFSVESLPSLGDLSRQYIELSLPVDECPNTISRRYGFARPPVLHVSACAASTDAIGTACQAIAEDGEDFVLAGGTDSMINPMGFAGFCRIGAMSTRNDDPEKASRPFDQSRRGFVMGEGAGFLVLEEKNHALRRGANILACLNGFSNSLDGYHASDPHPDGRGALLAMQGALRDAGLKPERISAISAHATGTESNDPIEATAIRTLLGNSWKHVPVLATKSMIGHLISASGVVETIAAILCMRESRLHPTLNLEQVGNNCELHHVRESRPFEINHVLKNSFGFGGKNSCLIISKS